MALTEDIRRLLGFDQPGNDAEIQFKIKPLSLTSSMQTQAPATPATSEPSVTGGGGETGAGGGILTPTAPAAQVIPPENAPPITTGAATTSPSAGYGAGGLSIVPGGQRVQNKNPSLVTHPLGAQTDDVYEAAVAQLQHQTQSQYMNLLQELGFMDEQGNFIPGTLETEAVRQRAELERQRGLSLQDVLENAVQRGTVFSGRRAKLTAQAQQPFDTGIANVGTVLSRELAKRYQGLGELTSQFELGRNMLISEAAQRIKESLMGGPMGPVGGEPQTPAEPSAPTFSDVIQSSMGGWGLTDTPELRALAARYAAQKAAAKKKAPKKSLRPQTKTPTSGR